MLLKRASCRSRFVKVLMAHDIFEDSVAAQKRKLLILRECLSLSFENAISLRIVPQKGVAESTPAD